MASPSRTVEREEERRHRTRTLVIASIASATAAVITSQLWIAGTWIAAAMTPVLVTFVSELLHRPTERLARRLTTAREEVVPDPSEPRPAETPSAPVRVYRAAPSTRRRRIAVGAVLGTAALAFVIAVAALTLPELVAGGSIGKGDRGTTFFGGKKRGDGDDRERSSHTSSEEQQRQEQPSETPTTTAPGGEETETTPTETAPTETLPTSPTEPAPQQ